MAPTQRTEKSDDEPRFRPVVVAPTYNNASTLLSVLDRIVAIGVPLIIVNDGSTDETASLLKAWAERSHGLEVHVLTHPRNRGKAAAMRTGFAHARRSGSTHAVTMDTDGQLEPEEIPSLLDAAAGAPTALVLGRRSEQTAGLPRSNLIGWYTSGLGLWAETGVIVRDSQCGLRVYPLRLFDDVRCWAGRFGFEAEIIARAVWAGCPIVEVPVTCRYPSGSERVSHIKPFRDGTKGFFLHWALAVRRLIPWPTTKSRNVETSPSPNFDVPTSRRFDVFDWASPLALLRQVRSSRLEQLIASAAFAHGVFMACLPLGWWAFVAAAYGSRRLHHNLVAAMTGALLTIPPVGPALAKVSITLGHLLTHFARPDFTEAMPGVDSLGQVLRAFPVSWCVGGLLLGTSLHAATIGVVFWALRRYVRLIQSR